MAFSTRRLTWSLGFTESLEDLILNSAMEIFGLYSSGSMRQANAQAGTAAAR